MKIVKLLTAVFLFFLLFASSLQPAKAALPVGPIPPCGPSSFSDGFNIPVTEVKLSQAFLIKTQFDPSLNLSTNKKYYYLTIVNNDIRGLVQTPGEFKNGVLTTNVSFDKPPDPGVDQLFLVNEDQVKSGDFAQPLCVTNSIKVVATRYGTTVNTCVPGTGTTGNCGVISTALGEFSGNPADLATIFYDFALGIAGGVALLMMIYASIKMISSRGDPDALQSGKQLFTSAIIGLLVIVFAAFIIRIIGTGLGIPGISLHLNTTAYAVSFPGNYTVNDPAGFKFGNGTIGDVVSAALPIILFFAGIAAFAFLVFGGIKYMISRGDPKRLDNARSTISFALLGLFIIIASYVILLVLQAVLKFNITSLFPTAYADVDLGTALGVKFTTFGQLFTEILKVVFPIAGIVFFFMLLWGGLRYMLSRGDDKAAGTARSILSSAVVGLLIVIGSYIILKVIEGITGISIIG